MSIIFNGALGKVVELYNNVVDNDPAASVFNVYLLKVVEAEDALRDHATIAAVLGAAGNTECDFTNYATVVWSDSELAAASVPDDTANNIELTFPQITYTDAGGTTDNSIVKLIVTYDDGSTEIPVFGMDYTETTTGSTLVVNFPTDFFTAQQGA